MTFEVSDQGRGIPQDKIESIFGRFQQVDASDSRLKGGTGLGLAICRSIVEQHGGLIWARSRVGVGSVFAFNLPAASGSGPTPQRHGPTVLVFDHHHSTGIVVRDAIQSQGHVVSVPSTIDRAVHLAKAHRPDVILLDLGIPGLLGRKALTAIRSEPTIRDIPTVILGCGRDGTVMSLHAALDAGRETARALIIEDEPDLRNELTTALTQRGIETMTADYASEAIEGLERFGPDLIVMGLSSLGTDWTPFIESIWTVAGASP